MADKVYPYDVFISYRWVSPDREWVRKQLAPSLINAGLKVFIDVKDFKPGRNLIREMERAEQESRQAICVISPDYFDGERMSGFENQLLQLSDPTGEQSRLIPLILVRTEMPKRIQQLIPIDWTTPEDRPREWKKLLEALNAKGLAEAPSGPDTTGSVVETVPLKPTRKPKLKFDLILSFARSQITLRIVLGLVIMVFAVGGYWYRRSTATYSISGTIYQKEEQNGGLVPVPNVVVRVANTNLTSKPTDASGRFTIEGLPRSLPVTKLIANNAGQDYDVPLDPSGIYKVIPQLADPTESQFFPPSAWKQRRSEDCVLPDAARYKKVARYVLEPPKILNPQRRQFLDLTINLGSLEGGEIASAYIIEPSENQNLYDTLPGNDSLHHGWRFKVFGNPITLRLELCLGTNSSSSPVSIDSVATSYRFP